MKTSRIYDLHRSNLLAVDLRHILRALGPRTLDCYWQISEETSFNEPVFATGDSADRLQLLSTSEGRIDGTTMRDLAEDVVQVIWGEFRAYEDVNVTEAWVIVRAIDSSFYEVISNDPAVHDAVQCAFRNVRPA